METRPKKDTAKRVGEVEHFYPHLGVAVVHLNDDIALGDTLRFASQAGNFNEQVASMQQNHVAIERGRPGQSIGIKITHHAKKGDVVYKTSEDEDIKPYFSEEDAWWN
ncbi:MAG: hypothetical protein Q8Q39_01385 [bacterium]|nr:hypothetical protein [bacterium]